MSWLSQQRRDYDSSGINTSDLDKNPIKEFDNWFRRASKTEMYEPNAMALATVSPEGKPSVRFVLLKSYDKKGFVFYTNYKSRKSFDIKNTPNGAFVFYWPILQQQVRIEGDIELLSIEESDKYFDNRPHGSKIGTWASPQSKPIPSREYLEEIKNNFIKKQSNIPIKRPEFWGGYRIAPNLIEFWQGRSDRLHDRIEYRLNNGNWNKVRLAP